MIVSRTPLRISFFGGATDFPGYFEEHGGKVLSTAISHFAYVTVRKEKFYGKTILNYMKKETVEKVDEIQNERLRECMKLIDINFPVELSLQSDVPSTGTGLGASSAFLVGSLNALWFAKHGTLLSKYDLASMACDLEINKLGEPIGWQDQFACAFGGTNTIDFNKEGATVAPVKTTTENLKMLESQLLAFYTSRGRQAGNVLTEQKEKIGVNLSALGEMKAQVAKGEQHLRNGDIDSFGSLLHEGWLLKKSLASGISDKDIDDLYNDAKTAGATGGKIAGAGGGGFLLLHVPVAHQNSVRQAMREKSLKELPIKFETEGTKIYHVGETF
ncbi:MAG: GHMP kinase [Candidatus Woesearchaeota archaeon]|nr:GHMP kinase [Candidatus Woesearchaeota archaeon]MDP7198365.1 GHMP kinase [Candidatus Woesearchaeota archaeon]MDP7467467.1 GHMP kinase [Candidatus Woesearchaeota archaeon]MDP7647694.1 GHMP kinase [Candidatus Woesearchaeota archaeon]